MVDGRHIFAHHGLQLPGHAFAEGEQKISPGLPEGILAGGQYDNLARRLSGAPGAIGFAVYADMLEKPGAGREYLADVLIVSNGNARAALAAAKKLRAEGRTVAVDAPEPCRETLVIQEDA